MTSEDRLPANQINRTRGAEIELERLPHGLPALLTWKNKPEGCKQLEACVSIQDSVTLTRTPADIHRQATDQPPNPRSASRSRPRRDRSERTSRLRGRRRRRLSRQLILSGHAIRLSLASSPPARQIDVAPKVQPPRRNAHGQRDQPERAGVPLITVRTNRGSAPCGCWCLHAVWPGAARTRSIRFNTVETNWAVAPRG